MTLELEEGMYDMSLDHFVVPKTKEALNKLSDVGGYIQGTLEPTENNYLC